MADETYLTRIPRAPGGSGQPFPALDIANECSRPRRNIATRATASLDAERQGVMNRSFQQSKYRANSHGCGRKRIASTSLVRL